MMERQLILKRALASRPSGEWNDDDFDVIADGTVVGRILKVHASPVGTPWMWSLIFGHHEDRTPTHGYAATREDAMAAFAKSWRRERPKSAGGFFGLNCLVFAVSAARSKHSCR
jgi:hypothetical protein